MMAEMTRIMVFDRLDNYLFDIEPKQVMDATYVSEINGEHSLTITTLQGLEKTNRLLIRDGMGIWHEYVVLGIAESHYRTSVTVKDYYCIWSLQYDLMGTFINGPYDCGVVPGHASIPQLPATAMGVALGGTSRWSVGTITVTTMASASFYRRSGWEGLQTVIEKWGGELQANITVMGSGVVSRSVDLLAHLGSSQATRRFDFACDVTSIKRTVSDDIWPCRIVPLGKSQETETGGYTRRPDISSVNNGVMWLQDDDVVPYVRTLNPNGEYEHPTAIVLNDTYEQPADLKAWATEHISEFTRPKVTYEASVLQFAQAGLNPHGVALGDNVVVVDRSFGADGLRIDARVTKIAGNLLDSSDTTLTIGNIAESLTDQLLGISRQVAQVSDVVSRSQQFQATAEYVSNLIGRLNGEINATGGYVYITEGDGLRTYDYPVSDPLVGTEATQVVEIKGGNFRIANSRTAGGDWDWKTVLVSGHIASELVTAVNIIAGFIGNASGSYWDLDNNTFVVASGATIGDRTVQELIDDVDSTITGVDVEYAESQSSSTAPQSGWSTTAPAWRAGYYIWSRTATTNNDGTTYSNPTCISGRDGVDGQDGADGADGVGITSTTITYGKSSSATTDPSSWGSSVPTLAQGDWLWVKTVYAYSDNTSKTTYTKSYIGTDGDDGTSVYIQNASKSGDTTTVIIADGEGHAETLTIVDGQDGENGTPGTNGLNGYVHVAWANSADGQTDFSTSVSTGKKYLGTYTDNTQADSQTPSAYSWSLIKGADGTSVTVSSIKYGTSDSASTQPSSWSTTAPTSITKGKWLWVKTTYNDSSTATTKSYIGTDGDDGTSVYVQSSTKSGGVTTVVLTDGTTPTTITINDGEDGTDGTPGTNGLNGYVHIAWANSADGQTDFSTSVSAGKTYIGVYTDNTQADSQTYSDYSWSLIKGADGTNGQDGSDGIGITSIVEQYYLSTSSSTQTGGSWGTSQPTWESGKYIWTRSEITWDTTPATTTTTTPVLAQALNGANATAAGAQADATQALYDASDAAKVATNYLSYSSSSGLDVGYSGTSAKTRIDGSGVEVFDGNGSSVLFAGMSGSTSIVRVGKQSGSGNVVMSSEGYVDVRNASTVMAHFGYGSGKNSSGGTSIAPYYDLGTRKSSTTVGNYSVAEGVSNEASGYVSHAEGINSKASGHASHAEGAGDATNQFSHAEGSATESTEYAAHAEGWRTHATGSYSHAEGSDSTASGSSSHAEGSATTASASCSHAEGYGTTASASYTHASGRHTIADSTHEFVCGKWNDSVSGDLFEVGCGTSSSRSNGFRVTDSGACYAKSSMNATAFNTTSDRRLKTHIGYLGSDAVEFVRKLRPALYDKDGARHVGFYAQDVLDADEWETTMVDSHHLGSDLGYDPLMLDYSALIAPLVAYSQSLERRIEQLEELLRGGER